MLVHVQALKINSNFLTLKINIMKINSTSPGAHPTKILSYLKLITRNISMILVLLFAVGLSGYSQYNTNGTTLNEGGGCFRLTEALNSQSGSVWFQNKISLASDLTIDANIFLGSNDGGADGIAFVLQPVCSGLGSLGGGLGYQGITPSLAVEFDTWQNASDPVQDHIGLMKNGNTTHGGGGASTLQGFNLLPNLENGVFHTLKIEWKAITQNLKVTLDGITQINYTDNIVANIFGGNRNVFWGFTAATGAANNVHRVCIVNSIFTEEGSFTVTKPSCPNYNNGAIDLNPAGGIGPFTYTWSNGATTEDISGITAGTYTVTVTDGNGCQSRFTIVVANEIDNQAPTISCNAPIIVSNDAGQCGAVVNYVVSSTDNCPGQVVTQTAGLASGAIFPIGTTTNTFLVTDASGNTATCSFTVTVNDTDNPTISCNASVVVNNDAGQCGAVVNYAVSSADNCPGQVVTQTAGLASGSLFPVGTTTNTFLVTDASGNTATCSFTVRVNDTENPTISCNAPVVVNNDAGQCGAVVNYVVSSTDNCSGQVVTQTAGLASGSLFPVGTTTNTFVVTDASSNTATCSFTVTVTDIQKPVINVSNILSCYAANNFGCSINLGATVSDNCPGATLTSNAPACFPVGTTMVTWTAVDINGNSSTATQSVTRNPEMQVNICAGPTRTIYKGTTNGVGPFGPQSVNLTSSASGGTPSYTYSWSPAVGLNNPSIYNPVASPLVTTIYTVTVTDSKGCTRSLSITIKVLPLSAALCGNGGGVKFNVCHVPPGNPSNAHGICISVNALNAHLTTGSNGHQNCYLGDCDQLCYSTTAQTSRGGTSEMPIASPIESVAKANIESVAKMNIEAVKEFTVIASPNPTKGSFVVQFISDYAKTAAVVRVLDANGKAMESFRNILPGKSIRFGESYSGGNYYVEVVQGSNRKVLQLVKVN